MNDETVMCEEWTRSPFFSFSLFSRYIPYIWELVETSYVCLSWIKPYSVHWILDESYADVCLWNGKGINLYITTYKTNTRTHAPIIWFIFMKTNVSTGMNTERIVWFISLKWFATPNPAHILLFNRFVFSSFASFTLIFSVHIRHLCMIDFCIQRSVLKHVSFTNNLNFWMYIWQCWLIKNTKNKWSIEIEKKNTTKNNNQIDQSKRCRCYL